MEELNQGEKMGICKTIFNFVESFKLKDLLLSVIFMDWIVP